MDQVSDTFGELLVEHKVIQDMKNTFKCRKQPIMSALDKETQHTQLECELFNQDKKLPEVAISQSKIPFTQAMVYHKALRKIVERADQLELTDNQLRIAIQLFFFQQWLQIRFEDPKIEIEIEEICNEVKRWKLTSVYVRPRTYTWQGPTGWISGGYEGQIRVKPVPQAQQQPKQICERASE